VVEPALNAWRLSLPPFSGVAAIGFSHRGVISITFNPGEVRHSRADSRCTAHRPAGNKDLLHASANSSPASIAIAHRPQQAMALTTAVREAWTSLIRYFTDPYRPELHYMRGPGPKWHAKHRMPEPQDRIADMLTS
jgi:hypothetical protein